MTHITRAICVDPSVINDLIPADRAWDFYGSYANILSDDDLYILRQCREMLGILKDRAYPTLWNACLEEYEDRIGDSFTEDWI